MKSQLQRIIERLALFFERTGRARAAAELCRLGYYKAAQQMLSHKSVA